MRPAATGERREDFVEHTGFGIVAGINGFAANFRGGVGTDEVNSD